LKILEIIAKLDIRHKLTLKRIAKRQNQASTLKKLILLYGKWLKDAKEKGEKQLAELNEKLLVEEATKLLLGEKLKQLKAFIYDQGVLLADSSGFHGKIFPKDTEVFLLQQRDQTHYLVESSSTLHEKAVVLIKDIQNTKPNLLKASKEDEKISNEINKEIAKAGDLMKDVESTNRKAKLGAFFGTSEATIEGQLRISGDKETIGSPPWSPILLSVKKDFDLMPNRVGTFLRANFDPKKKYLSNSTDEPLTTEQLDKLEGLLSYHPTIYSPNRKFVKEGLLFLRTDSLENDKRERQAFLFDDCLLFTKAKPRKELSFSYKIKVQVPIREAKIILVAHDKDERFRNAFQIEHKANLYTVTPVPEDSVELRDVWYREIKGVVKKYQKETYGKERANSREVLDTKPKNFV